MPKIHYDFSDNAILSVAPFNNRLVDEDVATTGTVIADLLDDTDSATGKSIVVDTPFSASAAGSSNASSGVGDFNEQSLETNWRTSNGGVSTYRITGFNADESFTLALAGHINNTSRHTKFTVNGVPQDYIVGTAANPTTPVIFNGTADENGEITVRVEKADSGEFYGYANGGVLEWSDTPPTPTLDSADNDNEIDIGQIFETQTTNYPTTEPSEWYAWYQGLPADKISWNNGNPQVRIPDSTTLTADSSGDLVITWSPA